MWFFYKISVTEECVWRKKNISINIWAKCLTRFLSAKFCPQPSALSLANKLLAFSGLLLLLTSCGWMKVEVTDINSPTQTSTPPPPTSGIITTPNSSNLLVISPGGHYNSTDSTSLRLEAKLNSTNISKMKYSSGPILAELNIGGGTQ